MHLPKKTTDPPLNIPKPPTVLPFPTREMLKFGQQAVFQLRVATQIRTSRTLVLTGATREGTFIFDFTPAVGAEINNFSVPDIPIWISLGEVSGDFAANEIYARVYLVLNGDRVQMLGSGYIVAGGGLTWPAISNQPALSGIGAPVVIELADPNSGAAISYTHLRNTVLKIDSIAFRLAADANSATRRVGGQITGGASGNITSLFNSNVTQLANVTLHYAAIIMAMPGTESAPFASPTRVLIALANNIYIRDGEGFNIDHENDQVGDDYTNVVIAGREWIDLSAVSAE